MNDIEKLFRWDKPRKTIKEWYRQDFLKMDCRPIFIKALQVTGGLCYVSLVFQFFVKGNIEASMMAAFVLFWYTTTILMTNMIGRFQKILSQTFESWGTTLDHFGKAVEKLNKSETEKARLQERIDNMLEP